MDINTLRAMRNQDFSKISSAFDSDNSNKNYEDNRFWKLERDKAGNASAVIRFLPRVEGDELPWVKVFSHGFKGPTGKWYIENSLTTVGKQDPVGELNTTLWNSGSDANKEIARGQKRRLTYISNIVVVSDPAHPENNGKVMLFKYGKKIFYMIMNKAQPTFEDEKPVNVFDLWEGANFKIRMRTVEGYPNYDQSVFGEQTPVAPTDEAIVAIVNQQVKLAEFIDPNNGKQFKSYDELKAKLDSVLSGGVAVPTAESMSNDSLPAPVPPPSYASKSEPSFAAAPAPVSKAPEINDDDEFDMGFFQKIANE